MVFYDYRYRHWIRIPDDFTDSMETLNTPNSPTWRFGTANNPKEWRTGVLRVVRWSCVCIVIIACFCSLLFVALFVQPTRSQVEHDNWEQDPATNLQQWLAKYTHSVAPLGCHSHNDYLRRYPLFSGIAAGCESTEADVWLSDDEQDLLVGHDRASLSPDKTLKSMYLDHLMAILDLRNSDSGEHHDARGTFDTQPNPTFVLLIDVKEQPAKVWQLVLQQLEPLRKRSFLTRYNHTANDTEAMQHGPIMVVGSGSLKLDYLRDAYSSQGGFNQFHDTFLDAPLSKVAQQQEKTPIYSAENSFYASASFKVLIGSVRFGFRQSQLDKLRGYVRDARASGLVLRLWDIPDWPVNYRDYIWQVLVQEGAGILNVDDLSAFSGTWETGYLASVVWIILFSVYSTVLCVVGLLIKFYSEKCT